MDVDDNALTHCHGCGVLCVHYTKLQNITNIEVAWKMVDMS